MKRPTVFSGDVFKQLLENTGTAKRLRANSVLSPSLTHPMGHIRIPFGAFGAKLGFMRKAGNPSRIT